jgi:hypothetical protein
VTEQEKVRHLMDELLLEADYLCTDHAKTRRELSIESRTLFKDLFTIWSQGRVGSEGL